MPYAQLSDVRGLIPQVSIDAQSKPNEGQVAGFIADVENMVNAILANIGYATPVTAPASVSLLRVLVAHGAAARTLRARAAGQNTPADIQGARDLELHFTSRMKALQDPADPFSLTDAVKNSEPKPDQFASRISSNFSDLWDDTDDRLTRDRVF